MEEKMLNESVEIDNKKIIGADFGDAPNRSHHHHHRHHDHRHHHHRRSSNKKIKKFVAFCKKNRSVLINVVSCTVSVILIIITAVVIDVSQRKGTEKGKSNITNVTESIMQIETSVYNKEISLVSEAVLRYINPDNTNSAFEVYRAFDGHKGGLNMGLPLNFTYRVAGLPSAVEVIQAELYISEHLDFQNPLIYNLDIDNSNIEIHNLKTGTKYYYKLNFTLTDNYVVGTNGSFTTKNTPRILNIDGGVNVRDIGGWETLDGNVIKQGLLYRGGEIDGAVESTYKLSDKGVRQMVTELGIKFDMDLRADKDNTGGAYILGDNIPHKYYNSPMYSDVLNPQSADTIKKIFSDLAKTENYPIYLHCTYGRDRTGSICYLLEALLGVSDKDLYKDYELSAFTDSYVNTAEFNTFVDKIKTFSGNTTQQRVEGYLLSIGVTADEISNIRQIFLG